MPIQSYSMNCIIVAFIRLDLDHSPTRIQQSTYCLRDDLVLCLLQVRVHLLPLLIAEDDFAPMLITCSAKLVSKSILSLIFSALFLVLP